MARLGAWDRALTRFGLEARPGSKLRARPGSGLGARLGSEPGSAHLGSENITRCPPAVRSWRRAKIVRNLCEIYHFAPLCLVLTIEEQSSNCISVPNFASLPKVSRSKGKMSVAYVHTGCLIINRTHSFMFRTSRARFKLYESATSTNPHLNSCPRGPRGHRAPVVTRTVHTGRFTTGVTCIDPRQDKISTGYSGSF